MSYMVLFTVCLYEYYYNFIIYVWLNMPPTVYKAKKINVSLQLKKLKKQQLQFHC